jgi:hypothetical protein
MKKYSIILIISLVTSQLYSQDTIVRKLNLGIDIGIVKYTLKDNLLNNYKYSATAISPINLHAYYFGKKNIHFVSVNYKKAKLSTTTASDLYNYNYIDLYESKINYEYFHKLFTISSKIDFFLGSSINLNIAIIHQKYKSKLWYENIQNSFDLTLNYAINALTKYQTKKGCFIFKIGYAIVGYGARPDDYFVNYGWSPQKNVWDWYSVGNFQYIPISLIYHRDISNHFSLKFEYDNEFHAYLSDRGLKLLKQNYLGGLSFKF